MYPIHLESQYESYFVAEFDRFSRTLSSQIRPILDALPRDTKDSPRRSISDTIAYTDADDPFSMIETVRAYILGMIKSDDDGKIEKIFQLLNAWNRSYIDECLEKAATDLDTPKGFEITGRSTPTKWIQTTNIAGSMIDTVLSRTMKTNVALKSSLFSEYATTIFDTLSDGLSRGASFRELEDELQKATGADRNRARFWARDQASKFYGEINKTRQTEAGVPGYIWRCVNDGHTRDNHYMFNGTYHDWNKPPAVGANGECRHPGEDFNCRCWAEPAFGKSYEDPLAVRSKIEDPAILKGIISAREMLSEIANITKITAPVEVIEVAGLDSRGAYSPRYGTIELKAGISSPISTATHEMAHYLDHRIFGDGKRLYGSLTTNYDTVRSSLDETEMSRTFSQIFKKGKTIRNIDVLTTGEVTSWFSYSVNGSRYEIRKSFLDYISNTKEVFARSMEKYFALKTGNDAMLMEIRNKEKLFIANYGFSQYPSDIEIKKMIPVLDTYFERIQ